MPINKHPFDDLRMKLEKELPKIPRLAGLLAVAFYKESWDRKGFLDARLQKWAKRKGKPDGRAILVKSGLLRRSIRLLKVSGSQVVIGTAGVVYASIHNEGFDGPVQIKTHKRKGHLRKGKRKAIKVAPSTVQAHTRTMKMPKRQFIGASKVLEAKIEKAIIKKLTNL